MKPCLILGCILFSHSTFAACELTIPLCQDRCRLHQIINGGDLEHRNEAFVRV